MDACSPDNVINKNPCARNVRSPLQSCVIAAKGVVQVEATRSVGRRVFIRRTFIS